MADRIRLRVARYRPETESELDFQEYEVPFDKDWVVLDGLNYVKDRLDGTLVVPLVVPHGRVRQLRDDGQRRAEADLRDVSLRLRARSGHAWHRSGTSPSFATSSSTSATSCGSWCA